jgi:hypothetical protein
LQGFNRDCSAALHVMIVPSGRLVVTSSNYQAICFLFDGNANAKSPLHVESLQPDSCDRRCRGSAEGIMDVTEGMIDVAVNVSI